VLREIGKYGGRLCISRGDATAAFVYNGDGLRIKAREPGVAEEDYFPPEAGERV
jgi:hypothetical protein